MKLVGIGSYGHRRCGSHVPSRPAYGRRLFSPASWFPQDDDFRLLIPGRPAFVANDGAVAELRKQ